MPVGVGTGSSSSSFTTTPTTFGDLYTDLLNGVRGDTTSSQQVNLAKRLINQANHDLHIQQNWPWAERYSVILTHAEYTTGSVSISASARTTLEGTGTAWNTAVTGMGFNNMRSSVRGKIQFSGDSTVYVVTTVSGDTAATLESRYVDGQDTATAYALAYGSYSYWEDEYALASDFWRLIDLRKFSDALPIPVLGRQEFYQRFTRNDSPNTPLACTILDVGFGSSTTPVYKVLFAPPPSTVLSIPYRYITSHLAVSSAGVSAANLSADADEPIIPLRYRYALVFYGKAQWYRDRKDDTRSAEAMGEYVDLVKRMANDTSTERDTPRLVVRQRYNPAGRYGGGRNGRYTTGSRWDELRD